MTRKWDGSLLINFHYQLWKKKLSLIPFPFKTTGLNLQLIWGKNKTTAPHSVVFYYWLIDWLIDLLILQLAKCMTLVWHLTCLGQSGSDYCWTVLTGEIFYPLKRITSQGTLSVCTKFHGQSIQLLLRHLLQNQNVNLVVVWVIGWWLLAPTCHLETHSIKILFPFCPPLVTIF